MPVLDLATDNDDDNNNNNDGSKFIKFCSNSFVIMLREGHGSATTHKIMTAFTRNPLTDSQ